MSGSTESTASELATIADNIGQYRARVADPTVFTKSWGFREPQP